MSGEHREGQGQRATGIPGTLPRAAGSPVGFDIETTGITDTDIVTVACAWTPTHQAHCFYGEDPSPVVAMLDEAKYIYTFNGMEFDLPRFARHCGRSMGPWARKTVDPLFAMKCSMGYGACAKLNDVLNENGYEPKSGSGLQAIQFWNDGNRDALLSYCMDDARLTHAVCDQKEVRWARKWVVKLYDPAAMLGLQEEMAR